MSIEVWITYLGILVALISLVIQQYRANKAAASHETRTGNKLTILYLCETRSMTVEEIVGAYKAQNSGHADEGEIRKTIYEMLCDETLLFNADSKKYEAKSFYLRSQSISKPSDSDQIRRQQQMQQQQ